MSVEIESINTGSLDPELLEEVFEGGENLPELVKELFPQELVRLLCDIDLLSLVPLLDSLVHD